MFDKGTSEVYPSLGMLQVGPGWDSFTHNIAVENYGLRFALNSSELVSKSLANATTNIVGVLGFRLSKVSVTQDIDLVNVLFTTFGDEIRFVKNSGDTSYTIEIWGYDVSFDDLIKLDSVADVTLVAGDYIEIKLVVAVLGICEVRLNGVKLIESVDFDFTVDGDITGVSGFRFLSINSNINEDSLSFSDFYFCDGTGTELNDFLNPIDIDVLIPIVNAAPIEWVPSTAVPNYQSVNNLLTASYNETDVENKSDFYEIIKLPVDGSRDDIIAIAPTCVDIKTGDGALLTERIMNISVNVFTSDDNASVFVNWYAQTIYTKNPNTLAPWTPVDINASTFGITSELV